MIKRNNGLIRKSKGLLWLSQGGTRWGRIVRRLVFGVLELREVVSGRRRVLELEFGRKREFEKDKLA